MTQTERRIYLTNKLLSERSRYQRISVPDDIIEQKQLLRSLMNERSPQPLPDEFLAEQDEYLREELARRGIVDISDLILILD